jgi:2-amino-4-hydroxy-6-hydroxymethyldihydropteridine diphosphokinase
MAEFTMLLGGNLGDTTRTFAQAETLIAERIGLITARSRNHVTEPWGFAHERLFLNRAIQVESGRSPAEVMQTLLAIESELGRTRDGNSGYSARTIDIDILLIENQVLDLPGLTVPHPRVQERSFALAPVADIAPLLKHPVLGFTVMEMLDQSLR